MLTSLCALALANISQTLEIVVSAPNLSGDTQLYAEAVWLGDIERVRLTDDGHSPGDIAGDGRRVASLTGTPVRALAIRLLAIEPNGDTTLLWSGMPDLIGDHDQLTFAAVGTGPLRLRPVISVPAGAALLHDPAASSLAGAGWGALVFLYASGMALTRRPR